MDLSWLQPAVGAGPAAAAHADVTRTTLEADRELELRWSHLRAALAAQGCPAGVVAAVADRMLSPTGLGGPRGRHVVAGGGGVLVDLVVPTVPSADVAGWGLVPPLLPLVRALDRTVDYVLVEVDHTGGDIHVVGRLEELEGDVTVEEVAGGHDVLQKVRGGGWGGWAHRRMQQRAEDSFQRNADAVLDELARVVARYRPRLVLLTGDPYSRGYVQERAAPAVAERLVTLESGGRADGTDREALAGEVSAVLERTQLADAASEVERFETERGSGEPVATGWHAVVHAARAGAVATLLLVDTAGATTSRVPRLWAGEQPMQLGHTEGELDVLGATERVEADGTDALLRALVAQGAEVRLLGGEHELPEGVAARLRFPLGPPVPGAGSRSGDG